MQHSAQQRSATHAAEHTRAQEHTGSTAAHSRARPASSCMHTAHSTAQLQHITIAVTKHAVHNSELIQIDKSSITTNGRAEQSTQHSACPNCTHHSGHSTAAQSKREHSNVWQSVAAHSTAQQTQHRACNIIPEHSAHHAQHTAYGTEHNTCGSVPLPGMFIIALHLRRSCLSSR